MRAVLERNKPTTQSTDSTESTESRLAALSAALQTYNQDAFIP